MWFNTLIVDDSAEFRTSLKALLHWQFPAMSVAEAGSASEAWQRLAEERPRLILADIRLRGEDGLDLTENIRRFCPDVVVAVVTVWDTPEYRKAAYAKGADCFVPKKTATLADVVSLVNSVRTGQWPQWTLGDDYLNPNPPAHPWK